MGYDPTSLNWQSRILPIKLHLHLVGKVGHDPTNLLLVRQLLSQLSYSPMLVELMGVEPTTSSLQNLRSPSWTTVPDQTAKRYPILSSTSCPDGVLPLNYAASDISEPLQFTRKSVKDFGSPVRTQTSISILGKWSPIQLNDRRMLHNY